MKNSFSCRLVCALGRYVLCEYLPYTYIAAIIRLKLLGFTHDASDGRWKFLVLPFCIACCELHVYEFVSTSSTRVTAAVGFYLGGYFIVRSYAGIAQVVEIGFQGIDQKLY